MTFTLFTLMLLAGVALVFATTAKYAAGALTARWCACIPVYTVCMCAMVYLL